MNENDLLNCYIGLKLAISEYEKIVIASDNEEEKKILEQDIEEFKETIKVIEKLRGI